MDEYDAQIMSIAKSVALSLNDINVRRSIKEETMQKIDGDYDILLKDFKEKSLQGQEQSFKKQMATALAYDRLEVNYLEKLASFDMEKFELEKEKNIELFDRFIDNNRQIQIAVPVHCADWNIETTIPVVVFQRANYDEQQENIEGFNSLGERIELDNKVAPDFPVVVVNLNERSDPDGNLLNKINSSSTPGDLIEIDDILPPVNFAGAIVSGSVKLTWSYLPSYLDVTEYVEIERFESGLWIYKGYKLASVLSYTDNDITANSTYQYRARIKREYNTNGVIEYSAYTNTVTVTNYVVPDRFDSWYAIALSSLRMAVGASYDNNDYSSLTSVRFYKKVNSQWTLMQNMLYNQYIDTDITTGMKYYYKIEPVNTVGNGPAVYAASYADERGQTGLDKKIMLKKMTFYDLTQYESWSDGLPEVAFSYSNKLSSSSSEPSLITREVEIEYSHDPNDVGLNYPQWWTEDGGVNYQLLDDFYFATGRNIFNFQFTERDPKPGLFQLWKSNTFISYYTKDVTTSNSKDVVIESFDHIFNIHKQDAVIGNIQIYHWDPVAQTTYTVPGKFEIEISIEDLQ